MEIAKATIQKVAVGIDIMNRLGADIEFVSDFGRFSHWFISSDPKSALQLITLMRYTGASSTCSLNNREINLIFSDNSLLGFGNPIDDKYVPLFTEEFREISMEEFMKLQHNL